MQKKFKFFRKKEKVNGELYKEGKLQLCETHEGKPETKTKGALGSKFFNGNEHEVNQNKD